MNVRRTLVKMVEVVQITWTDTLAHVYLGILDLTVRQVMKIKIYEFEISEVKHEQQLIMSELIHFMYDLLQYDRYHYWSWWTIIHVVTFT